LEATEGRTRADQRAGSGEAVVVLEEASRKNGPNNMINIDRGMTYIPSTSRMVQLVSARVRQIPKLEELISARALLGSIYQEPEMKRTGETPESDVILPIDLVRIGRIL